MNGPDAARIHRDSYSPTAAELRRQLSDMAAGLVAQFADLKQQPTPERCERLSLNLQGASRHVLLLRAALLSEGREDGQ